MKKIQFTQEGYDNLKNALEELRSHKRPAAVERLSKARAMGDLSENSEYTAAKEDLALVEGRLLELEDLLKNAAIIAHVTTSTAVAVGCHVSIETNGKKDTFLIVGEFESDPLRQKLSHISPLGKALLGKKVGDTITVNVPLGKITYKILEIKRS